MFGTIILIASITTMVIVIKNSYKKEYSEQMDMGRVERDDWQYTGNPFTDSEIAAFQIQCDIHDQLEVMRE